MPPLRVVVYIDVLQEFCLGIQFIFKGPSLQLLSHKAVEAGLHEYIIASPVFPFVFYAIVAAFPAVSNVIPYAKIASHLADRVAVEPDLQHLLIEGSFVLATTNFLFHLDLLR